MTRAAIYGRYSSEGQREASIDDQARNCERRAKQDGWTIVQRYADKGASGSKDEKGREGYRAMLEGAKGRQFDILLVDDLSRLSRDEAELILTRRKLLFWGVRLVGVSDGFDSEAKGHKIQATIRGLMNDIYLDDLREKTHRGLAGQALKGYNCGGRTYGYRHVPEEHPTETDEFGRPRIMAVRREIDPDQARWVRQIFRWYADGKSPRWIAGELNRLGVPAPGAAYKRRCLMPRAGTWSASALHGDPRHATGLLNNPLYIGRMIWNRRMWVLHPETKRRLPKLRPESDWIVVERPELRIIPQPLWERAQARRRAQREAQTVNGTVRRGPAPRYLLSGLLICGECGSSFVMADSYRYGCAGHLNRGASVCKNALRVARALAEARCLSGIQDELTKPEVQALFIKEITHLLAERRRNQEPEQGETHRRLATVEREITNLMKAIKAGILTPTTKAELERAEAERARLQATLRVPARPEQKVIQLLPKTQERYRALVANLGRLSAGRIAEARQCLREFFGQDQRGVWRGITLVPTAEGYLLAEVPNPYAGLVKLAVGDQVKYFGCGGRI